MIKTIARLTARYEDSIVDAPFAVVQQNAGSQSRSLTVSRLTIVNLTQGYDMPAIELHKEGGFTWKDQALEMVEDLHDLGVPEGQSHIEGMDNFKVIGRLSDGTDRDVTSDLIADGWKLWRELEDAKANYLQLNVEFRR